MIFFIQNGANLEVKALPQGKTMLLDAFHKGYIDLVQFLLKSGASTDARDERGRTATEYIKSDYNGKS